MCTAPFTDCAGNGTCRVCGGLGERCCGGGGGGDFCAAPFACVDTGFGTRCAVCGSSGGPCCPGGVCNVGTCNNQSNTCN
jgi:hypothetical protein